MKSKKVNSRKKNTNPAKKTTKSGKTSFWQDEYQEGNYFSLSMKPGNELMKFAKWFEREHGKDVFPLTNVLDVGCGNGRNLLFLAERYRAKGIGFDIAQSAIDTANKAKDSAKLSKVSFFQHALGGTPLPVESDSVDLVLDLMVSHCLKEKERQLYKAELTRVLTKGATIFIKTFLKEGDQHATRLIKENPAGEHNAYIHPVIGIYEYVWTERAFREFWETDFEIKLLNKSHGYQRWGGQPYKRRYLIAFMEKKDK